MRYPVWTARCRSGFEFPRIVRGRVRYHACKRSCSRGELLCAECATAQSVPVEARVSLLARVARSLRGVRVSAPSYAEVAR
jgi:hypothetical protein